MDLGKLITISATLAFLVVSTGQLPKALKTIRSAQLRLIKESQASKWGTPLLLPIRFNIFIRVELNYLYLFFILKVL